MRVLIVPELYRPDELTANGTVNDAVVWVEQWLDIDPRLHVYWLLPSPRDANYDPGYVLADRERVTLVEAEPFMHGAEHEGIFTESGYSKEQLYALKEAIYDRFGYVDIVVDQLRRGRADLTKWLLALDGHPADAVEPFSVITNVHDLQLPFKYASTGWRNRVQRQTEIAEAVLGDGMWFKASVDADGMREYGREFLDEGVLDAALDDAVQTWSPIDFDHFEESYSERPEWFHVAGSVWEKKQTGLIMDIAERLHEEFGIRTLMTSMGHIPDEYAELPWVEAHSEASRQTFEDALRRGDLTVSATEYETLARTWFEQAASGQVLVVRAEPWVFDCIPGDYRLAGGIGELADLAVWAVEHWDEAVEENRRMLAYVRTVRDPEQSGKKTYDDMARRVEGRLDDRWPSDHDAAVEDALTEFEGEVSLSELAVRAGGDVPITDRESYSIGQLVSLLRTLGYEDAGNSGTPVFREKRHDT
ncbi:hypothetical protein [Haladaptatus halobius]|uniref:hypothetical protein n=1 Tax=Haladaptatus halobius TaxID=2884875 RepID=UPI001D09D13B|nr:hypothetical protein [Haladaptatus halobius]